jgi:stage V sporulation protein R
MLEFLQNHTNVVAQPPFNSRWFSGINPYALGFAMWRDIQRICQQPDRRRPRLVP